MVRIIVALTGASGSVYGVRLLEVLRESGVEIHLIVSEPAKKIITHELDMSFEEVSCLADVCYDDDDMFAGIASGSFISDGLIVCPCSMKTLSGIATGYAESLIARVAMCMLKESRRLVLVPRETPLDLISLRNMVSVREAGGTILPACPGFYMHPERIDDLVDFVVGRVVDQFGLGNDFSKRWK